MDNKTGTSYEYYAMLDQEREGVHKARGSLWFVAKHSLTHSFVRSAGVASGLGYGTYYYVGELISKAFLYNAENLDLD